MRKLILFALLLAGPMLWASEYSNTTITATTTSQDLMLDNASEVQIINDGAVTVYVRVFDVGTPPSAATSGNIPIKAGEAFKFANVGAVAVIADSSTASIRFIWR